MKHKARIRLKRLSSWYTGSSGIIAPHPSPVAAGALLSLGIQQGIACKAYYTEAKSVES